MPNVISFESYFLLATSCTYCLIGPSVAMAVSVCLCVCHKPVYGSTENAAVEYAGPSEKCKGSNPCISDSTAHSIAVFSVDPTEQ